MTALEMHRKSIGVPDDWVEMVTSFHRKFAPSLIAYRPEFPPSEDADPAYAVGFIAEELAEICDAVGRRDLPGLADGLADLIYVAIRAAIIHGIDLRPVFAAVHEANMRKEGGEIRPDMKVLKPPGFVPPDVAGILRSQGWES